MCGVINLKLTTLQEIIYNKPIKQITVFTNLGYATIMHNHEKMIMLNKNGIATIIEKETNQTLMFYIHEGFTTIGNNICSVNSNFIYEVKQESVDIIKQKIKQNSSQKIKQELQNIIIFLQKYI